MDPLAIYAAALATIGFGWQVATYIRSRHPRLRVEGLVIFLVGSHEDAEALAHAAGTHEWPEGIAFRLQADVTNAGESAAKVQRVEFKQRVDGGMRTWVVDSSENGQPLELAPGDARQFSMTHEDLEGFDPAGFTTVQVSLPNGKDFVSAEFGRPVPDTSLVMLHESLFQEYASVLDPKRLYVHEVYLPDPGGPKP